jgi:hypothetical protein
MFNNMQLPPHVTPDICTNLILTSLKLSRFSQGMVPPSFGCCVLYFKFLFFQVHIPYNAEGSMLHILEALQF